MKTCYIFGAAKGLPTKFTKNENDLIIAADAGFNALSALNVLPDIVLGDFDSLGHEPDFDGKIIKHPVKKDDTDTLLAVKVGFDEGFKRFVIYGGTGNRLDHTLANIQTLSYVTARGGSAYLCGEDYVVTVITDRKISFKETAKGNLSLFACTSKCENVNIKGLLYELVNAEISFDFPIGVSNEFVGTPSEISLKKGSLAVVWSGNLKDLQE